MRNTRLTNIGQCQGAAQRDHGRRYLVLLPEEACLQRQDREYAACQVARLGALK